MPVGYPVGSLSAGFFHARTANHPAGPQPSHPAGQPKGIPVDQHHYTPPLMISATMTACTTSTPPLMISADR